MKSDDEFFQERSNLENDSMAEMDSTILVKYALKNMLNIMSDKLRIELTMLGTLNL